MFIDVPSSREPSQCHPPKRSTDGRDARGMRDTALPPGGRSEHPEVLYTAPATLGEASCVDASSVAGRRPPSGDAARAWATRKVVPLSRRSHGPGAAERGGSRLSEDCTS